MPIPGDVRKAIELLRTQPARRVSIRKLAASCGVAPRTLQKHFREFVGKTPGELRFEARMDQARRELLRAKPDVSVAEIATSCGITHLGRFAALYRTRFGETPSATLRRRRQANDSLGSLPLMPSRRERPVIAIHRFTCSERISPLGNFDLSAEIAAGLMRDRWFVVGSPEKARYHLRGNVRHDGNSLRITAMLASGEAGHCLWADRWQGGAGDIAALESRFVARVTAAVRRSLLSAEFERASDRDPAQASGWELTMQALPRAMRFDGAALARAFELLEQAMELAPTDGLPIALAAWCRAQRGGHNFVADPAREKACALELAARGAGLASDDPIAEALFGGSFALAGDFGRAALHIDRALALDGGSAWAWNRLGMLEIYRGNFRDATEAFQIARNLDPGNPLDFMCSIGFGSAHVEAGRYEESTRWFAHAIAEHPAAVWINRFRAPALLLAGKKDDARRAFADLTRKHPDLSIAAVRSAIPYTDRHWNPLAEGLVDLGMPL